MEWQEVVAAATGYASLATADASGRPHASKVAPVFEGDIIWVLTRVGSKKARNIRANPHAALLWSPAAEVYVSADATLVDDPAQKESVWTSELLMYDPATFFGAPDDPGWVLVHLAPTSALVIAFAAGGLRRQRWTRG